VDKNTCRCNKGFINAPIFSRKSKLNCQYKQKNIYLALFLESITFVGLGHFYSHQIILFLAKLSLFLTTLILKINSLCFQRERSKFLMIMSHGSYYCMLTIYLLYHSFDVFVMYVSGYTDGYGIPMSSYIYSK